MRFCPFFDLHKAREDNYYIEALFGKGVEEFDNAKRTYKHNHIMEAPIYVIKPQQNFRLDLPHKIINGNITRNVVLNIFDLQNGNSCMSD